MVFKVRRRREISFVLIYLRIKVLVVWVILGDVEGYLNRNLFLIFRIFLERKGNIKEILREKIL